MNRSFARRSAVAALATTHLLLVNVGGTLAADVQAPVPVTPIVTNELLAGDPVTLAVTSTSGTLVAFTSFANHSQIHYADVANDVAGVIPRDSSTARDDQPDVDGSTIVFVRRYDVTGHASILTFDPAAPAAGTSVVASRPAPRLSSPAIGGTTVAWTERIPNPGIIQELFVRDLATETVVQLTAEGKMNRSPSVSPEGDVIVWERCPWSSDVCSIMRTSKSLAGGWEAPVELAPFGASFPDTDGERVAYLTGSVGNADVNWVGVDGTGHGRLVMPGWQTNPHIDGNLISFESREAIPDENPHTIPADLFVYDIVGGDLYRLTATETISETWSSIGTGPGRVVRVPNTFRDPATGTYEARVSTFLLPYEVCPLFDGTKSHRAGSTVAIRIRVCESDGTNVSGPELTVTAAGLVKRDSTASTAMTEDAGNANPDGGFRYDPELEAYAYNLSTRGLSRGTWELRFTVTGDPNTYGVRFDIR